MLVSSTSMTHQRDRFGEAPRDTGALPAAIAVVQTARRAAILTGVIALLVTTAGGMLAPITAVLFVSEFGWSQTEYGAVTGGAAIFAGLLGSIGGGFLADLLGARRVVATASITLAIILTVFGLQIDSIDGVVGRSSRSIRSIR